MMTSTIRKFGVGVASIALVAGAAAPAFADPVDNRLAGESRYDTAIAIAMDDTEFNNPTVVYVARGDLLIDAVTAGTLKNGPMLLVNDDAKVQDKVAAAIKKLAPGKVVVIGGEKAVSKETVEKIAGTITTERLSGKDRFATAAAIAGKFKSDDIKKVYLANGMSLVDALVGGQLTDGPILLTNGADSLPEATSKALNKIGKKPLRALGGTQAVSAATLKQAGVDQAILLNTYIEDYQAELKASALADMKVKGYLVAAPKVKLDDLKSKLSITGTTAEKEVKEAKIAATFPKVSKEYINTGNNDKLWSVKDKDGKVEADTYTNATALGRVSYKDESGVVNYAGTETTYNDTYDASQASFTVEGAATNLFGKFPVTSPAAAAIDSNVDISQDLSGKGAAFGAASKDELLAKLFSDKVTPGITIKKFLEEIGVTDFPAQASNNIYLSLSTAADLTAAKDAKKAFDKAVTVAKTVVSSNLSGAKSANEDAKKAQKDAKDAFDKKRTGGVNTDVERISGSDRYSTSVEVAKAVFGEKGSKGSTTASRIYLANGNSFADAAVAGMLTKGPVLLVGKDMIPSTVNDYSKAVASAVTMSRKNIVALGGTGVIEAKNLTDQLDVLAPIGASKDYSASFEAPQYSTDASTNFAAFTQPQTVVQNSGVKVATELKNVPNGGNQKLVWQYNSGSGWKDIDGDTAVGSLTFSGFNTNTLKFTAVNGTKKDVKVRLAVKVVNANGDDLVSPQYSSAIEIKG